MADDLLAAATDALRETPVEADGAGTRLRVRRSLEVSQRGRRQLAGFLTGTGILLAGTMSWAFATGRAEAVWHAIIDPAPVHVEAAEPDPVAAAAPARASAARAAEPQPQPQPQQPAAAEPAAPERHAPDPEPAAAAPAAKPPAATAPAVKSPAAAAPAAKSPAAAAPAAQSPAAAAPSAQPPALRAEGTASRAAVPPPPVEALYRRAHELHFHGGDHPAAIAAWEAYLAAEPTGRFVAEARYNRALLLIRVGRYAEARAALAPYARGEIAGGYRRAEAARLIERLPQSEADRDPDREADRDPDRDR